MGEQPKMPLDDALADLEARNSVRVGPVGCVDLAIAHHPDKADLILGGVRHPRAQASVVSRWLADQGVDLSQWAINRHRRKDCRCETR